MRQVKNKILIYLLGLLFFCLTWPSYACSASDYSSDKDNASVDSQFEMEFEFGYENHVKFKRFMPVIVNCLNKGEHFMGTITLVVSDNPYEKTLAYTQSIEIKESEQSGASFYVPVSYSEIKMSIFLKSDDGNEVYSETFFPSVTSVTDIFVGVPDKYLESLSPLSKLQFDKSDIQFGNISIKLIPISENMENLYSFDLVIMDALVLSNLYDEQQDMLNYWISEGGILLTDEGDIYDESNYKVQNYYQGKIISFKHNLGGSSLAEQENTLLIYEALSAELSESDWQRILAVSYPLATSYIAESIVSNIMPENIPNVSVYIIMISIYVVVLIIIFLILKKNGRQRYIHIALLGMAFIFVALIFIIGGKTKQSNPFLNYTSIIELEESNALENTFVILTSPDDVPYEFTIQDEYTVNILKDYNHIQPIRNRLSNEPLDQELSLMNLIDNNENTLIAVNSQKAFDTTTFMASHLLNDVGSIDVKLTYDGNGYKGAITNSTPYDLTDAGVITPYTALILENIASGETIDVYIENDRYNSGLLERFDTADYLIQGSDGSSLEYTAVSEVSRRNILMTLSLLNLYGNDDEPYFVAFTNDFKPQLLEDINYNAAGNTLIVKKVDISFEHNGIVNYPDSTAFATVLSGDVFMEEDTIMSKMAELEYTFSEELWIDSLKMNEAILEKLDVSVYFYNRNQEEYEQVFIDENGTIDDLSPYLNKDNQLIVRFINNSYGAADNAGRIPQLAASGRVK